MNRNRRSRARRQRLLLLGGIALALVVIVILTACLIGAGSRNRKYTNLHESACASYEQQDYDGAMELLKQALAIRKLSVERQAELYLLMADVYEARGSHDAAMALLEDAWAVLQVPALQERLLALSALPAETPEPEESGVVIGSVTIGPEAVSAVLSSMGLTSGDIAPLAGLTGLQTLNLSGNDIDDISALSGLTAMDYLALANNRISDLTPLSGMTSLRTLYLDGNPVTDFTPLYGLSSLNLLSLVGIEMEEEQMQALCESLPNCTVYCDSVQVKEETEITVGGRTIPIDATEVELVDLGITDISELVKLKNVQVLNLQGNSISDISPLSALTTLTKLILWDNEVVNIYPLAGLTNLTYLDLDSNNVQDLTPLSGLTNLTSLWCSGNDPVSLEPLSGLTRLSALGLKNDGLSDGDLEWLRGLTGLYDLRLGGNDELTARGIDALQSALPGCTILRPEGLSGSITLGGTTYYSDAAVISCSGAGVSDISALSGFTALTSLSLPNNNLSDLSALSGLTGLTSLDLSYNTGITSLSSLSGLTNLSSLSLAGCSGVTDASALYGMTNLYTLDVRGTGLSWEQTDMLRATLPQCAVYSDAVMPEETVEGDIGAETWGE